MTILSLILWAACASLALGLYGVVTAQEGE